MKRLVPIGVIAILGGIFAHVGIFLVLQIEAPEAPSGNRDDSGIRYLGDLGVRSDPVLSQQALLLDSAPLFMPTQWNLASRMEEVASLREATEVFSPFTPLLALPRAHPEPEMLQLGSKPPVERLIPEGPAFVLARLGRSPVPDPADPWPASAFDVVLLGEDGPATMSPIPIPGSLKGGAPKSLWTPAQLFFQMVNGQPAGLPILAKSSGFPEWDRRLQAHIHSPAFYRYLEDGYFRITVHP